MASLKETCDSINKFIKRRLEEFEQEIKNAHFTRTTLQVNISNLKAEFRNVMNVLRIEILEEIRSFRKDLLELISSDSVRDDATYTMSPEPEDLADEPQRKRRRPRVKRTRITDHGVELRCESEEQGRIVIQAPETTLLTRPTVQTVEEVLFRRPAQKQVEEVIQAETSIDRNIQDLTIKDLTIQEQVMQDISNGVNISVRNVQNTETVARVSMDIADLPTNKPITMSPKKRASENENTPKKRRAQRPSTLDLSAEIPHIVLPPNEQSNIEQFTSILQEVNLADLHPSPARPGIEPATLTQRERRTHGSEGSETPLGSLDRTKVSLGESEKTTDSKRFIDEQWGVQGTMLKIFRCVVKGVPRITVESLVQRGPVIESRRRIIAARCFTSILKLQSNGFIKVTKDRETISIKHIELGPRITKGL